MTGVPILFVHGFPLDHEQWRPQLERLTAWRCIAPDLRGVKGGAAPAGGYSMGGYADDLAAELDAAGVESAICCGLSMGGYVLFELLRRYPQRVRGLILCDTKAEPDTPEGKAGRDELARVAEREGAAAIAERLLPKLLGPSTRAQRPRVVEVVRAMAARVQVAGLVGALAAMRDRPDSVPLLEEIRVPTLVLGGSEDEISPAAGMRAMALRIRGARYVEVPEAGHLAPLERPELVNGALEEFLLHASFR
ncbi:MAG TPA: alpha/beta fold hydrolase [Gemmatimonadales bacterium]|jgi:pimeloyl-ACP methyl ester carboxylesterase|nr:alpha/beta fold hydrolase [Gemmatimonadales bacterium]